MSPARRVPDGHARDDVQSPTAIVASDDQTLCRSVQVSLVGDGFIVILEPPEMGAVVPAVLRARPHVLLLDVDLSVSGMRTVEDVAAAAPDVLTVVIDDSPTDDELFGALRAGAAGFIPRRMPADRLPISLRSLLRGEALLPRSLTTRLVEEFRAHGWRKRLSLRGGPGTDLTSRERAVLQLIADDLGTKEIAARLFVSPVTVRTHISSIMRKMDVPDRPALRRLIRQR